MHKPHFIRIGCKTVDECMHVHSCT